MGDLNMKTRSKRLFLLLAVLTVLLLATDCTGNSSDTSEPTAAPVITATSTPSPTSTPTSTPTPSPSPSPSPTPILAKVTTTSIGVLKNSEETVFPDYDTQLGERPLLVLLLDYKNSEMEYDDLYAEAWSYSFFGSGSMEHGAASVNDYFKEISNGRFSLKPVLLGKNKTGVYTFHLNKNYTDAQGLEGNNGYPFFDFDYDVAKCMDELKKEGLNTEDFAVSYVNKKNYEKIMMGRYNYAPNEYDKEDFTKPMIAVVFPSLNVESVRLGPISTSLNLFGAYAHINEDSSFGTVCHELAHMLGAFDVYYFGYYYNDLMSEGINISVSTKYNVTHINPYYKLQYGWCEADILREGGQYTLYSSSTGKYRPLLIPTDDPNQYFLVEARDGTGFDSSLMESDDTTLRGVTVWRVDQTSLNTFNLVDSMRGGITMESVLPDPGCSFSLQYFSNYTDATVHDLKSAGVTITVLKDPKNGTFLIDVKKD